MLFFKYFRSTIENPHEKSIKDCKNFKSFVSFFVICPILTFNISKKTNDENHKNVL